MRSKTLLEELGRLREQVNTLFEQAMLHPDFEGREGELPGTWRPAVDVLETGDAYILFAELPGVQREDIHVEVLDRRLELSGRRRALGEGRNFHRMERNYGPFRRSFDFGAAVKADEINAAFQNGVLTITVPKRESGGGKQTVPVRDDASGGER